MVTKTRYCETDQYLTGFIHKDTIQYNLEDANKCPRCLYGIIIKDFGDKVCLNCGLRETESIDPLLWTEQLVIFWLIRNQPRQLFSTEDYLQESLFDTDTKIYKIPSYHGKITSRVQDILLEFAKLEQHGIIKVRPRGIISDYESVMVVYDIVDKKASKRLAPAGVL
jgi:hypothetical protein